MWELIFSNLFQMFIELKMIAAPLATYGKCHIIKVWYTKVLKPISTLIVCKGSSFTQLAAKVYNDILSNSLFKN